MRLLIWAALGVSGLGLAGWTAVEKFDADGFVFNGKDGAKLSIVGVCQVTTDKVECWTPQGADSPSLAEQVSANFISQRQSLNLRFKHRNLLMLTRFSDSRQSGFRPSQWKFSEGADGNYGMTVDQGDSGRGETTGTWLYPADDQKTIDAVAFGYNSSGQAGLKIEKGAKATVAGSTIEILSIMRADKAVNGMPKRPRWEVMYNISPDLPPSEYMIYPVLINQKGEQITAVDDKGDPAPMNQMGYGFGGRPGFMYQTYEQIQGGWAFYANPGKVKEIRLTISRKFEIGFKNISLYAKG